jgi:endoglucanase
MTSRAFRVVKALFALSACVVALTSPLTANASGEYQRGVNLSHWFEHEGRAPVSLAAMRSLRRAGFDHVRIPVDPRCIGWTPTHAPAELELSALQQAIDQALEAGLDVIVDVSPEEASKPSIENDDAVFKSYAAMLAKLARPLAQLPADRVALELLNEPQFYGWRSMRWQSMQAQLIESVRAVAPTLTLIAMGRKGGSLEGLALLDPYADPHIIYSFHYYLPFIFTHQGAEWLADDQGTTAGMFGHVLYPSELSRGTPPLMHPSAKAAYRAQRELSDYLGASWGETKIAAQLQPAQGIAQERRVRIICDEFGVIRSKVDPASRNRWLHDVRAALESMGIGWTVWDYADEFGVATKQASAPATLAPELDRSTLAALGLSGVRQ